MQLFVCVVPVHGVLFYRCSDIIEVCVYGVCPWSAILWVEYPLCACCVCPSVCVCGVCP